MWCVLVEWLDVVRTSGMVVCGVCTSGMVGCGAY